MNWAKLQIEKEFYRQSWENFKANQPEDLSKFLKKSYLVVAGKWQFGIDDDLITAAKEYPGFFINKGVTAELLDIVRQIKIQEGLKAGDKEELKDLVYDANDIDEESILIIDNWTIEPVFPTVDMPFIQAIKQSNCCDKERTEMRAYSIRVVLKKMELKS